MARAKRKAVEYPTIDAVTVWAAACAALRVNGHYTKVSFVKDPDAEKQEVVRPNKDIMREFMFNPSTIADEDYQQAEVVRTYWRDKLMDVLTGTSNQFTTQAVELASKDEFKANEWLGLATIAYLPFGYTKSVVRDEQQIQKMEAVSISRHFGKVGDKVTGTAMVIDARYSQNWNTYYVTAKFGTDVIFFAYRENLEAGTTINFAGTIKAHRDEGITQLNRVKIK